MRGLVYAAGEWTMGGGRSGCMCERGEEKRFRQCVRVRAVRWTKEDHTAVSSCTLLHTTHHSLTVSVRHRLSQLVVSVEWLLVRLVVHGGGRAVRGQYTC